jgi:hypothetical protein
VSPAPVRQALELAGYAHEPAVRLDASAGVGDPELGRMRHDLVNCARTGQQRHLARDCIDARSLPAKSLANRSHGLAGAHADVHAHTCGAQGGKGILFSRGVAEHAKAARRGQVKAAS